MLGMSQKPSGSGRSRSGLRFSSLRCSSSLRYSHNRHSNDQSPRFIGSGRVLNRCPNSALGIATCEPVIRWSDARYRRRTGCRNRPQARHSNGRMTGRNERHIRKVPRLTPMVRQPTDTAHRQGASITLGIRLGVVTSSVRDTGRRLANSGRVMVTGPAIAVTGPRATATRIGMDLAAVTDRGTGLATGIGPILATDRSTTATSPATGTARDLAKAGTARRLVMVPAVTVTAKAATGPGPTATATAAAMARLRRLVNTVLPATEAMVAPRPGIRRASMGTVRHPVATTTDLRRSTAATAISSDLATTHAVTRATTRRGLAMIEAGQAGPVQALAQVLDLTAGYHRVGKTGDGPATRRLVGRISGPPIR